MEIQYRRNFHESYMIMEAPDGSDFYEERMMRRNDIPYLLSFRRMEVNGRRSSGTILQGWSPSGIG